MTPGGYQNPRGPLNLIFPLDRKLLHSRSEHAIIVLMGNVAQVLLGEIECLNIKWYGNLPAAQPQRSR